MKSRRIKLLISIAIPLLGGALVSLSGRSGQAVFDTLNKPPLSPPAWVFPVVWTILYILMGIASYMIYTSDAEAAEKNKALSVYAAQLVFNFIWPTLFFGCRLYTLAFVWLVLLWLLILITSIRFERISKTASELLLPYLIWTAFAGYLNLATAILN